MADIQRVFIIFLNRNTCLEFNSPLVIYRLFQFVLYIIFDV